MTNITTFTPSVPNTETIISTTSWTTSFDNNTSENHTTAEREESTVTSTVTVTRTAFPTTSNTSEVTYRKENGKDGSAAIIGGCVGGILAVIVLVIVILVIRRMRRNRRNSSVPTLPDKDFLDTLHTDHAISHHRAIQPTELEERGEPDKRYANLKANGETDEQTDPSVDTDGYLKKTKNFFGKHLHKKHKKGKNHAKMNAKRTDSMPITHAPPPPRESSQYAEGRIPVSSYKDQKRSDTSAYVNVCSQQKPEKNNKSKEKSKERKGKEQKDTAQADKSLKSDIKEQETQKVYENVENEGVNYYNLNQNRQDNSRLSTYEDVDAKTLQQDDVYENP